MSDKADEPTIYYLKRTIAFAIDVLVYGLCTFGIAFAGFYGLMMMASFDALFQFFNFGETPGKKLLGLRVTDQHGQPVSFQKRIMRSCLKFAVFGAIYHLFHFFGSFAAFALLITVRRRTVYDFLFGTIVCSREQNPGLAFYPRANVLLSTAFVVGAAVLLSFNYQIVSYIDDYLDLAAEKMGKSAVTFRVALQEFRISLIARNTTEKTALDDQFKRLQNLAELQEQADSQYYDPANAKATYAKGYRLAVRTKRVDMQTMFVMQLNEYELQDIKPFVETEDLRVLQNESLTKARKELENGDFHAAYMEMFSGTGMMSGMPLNPVFFDRCHNMLAEMQAFPDPEVLYATIPLRKGLIECGTWDDPYCGKLLLSEQVANFKMLGRNETIRSLTEIYHFYKRPFESDRFRVIKRLRQDNMSGLSK